MDDATRKAIEDEHNVLAFLNSPGGYKVQDIIQEKIDEFISLMGAPKAQHSPEYYAGGVAALRAALVSIYGCISYGERAKKQAQEAQRREVESLGRGNPYESGQPRPARPRSSRRNLASREAI